MCTFRLSRSGRSLGSIKPARLGTSWSNRTSGDPVSLLLTEGAIERFGTLSNKVIWRTAVDAFLRRTCPTRLSRSLGLRTSLRLSLNSGTASLLLLVLKRRARLARRKPLLGGVCGTPTAIITMLHLD